MTEGNRRDVSSTMDRPSSRPVSAMKNVAPVFLLATAWMALSPCALRAAEALQCEVRDASAPVLRPPPVFPAAASQQTLISADFSRTEKNGSTRLRGNVVMERDALRVSADEMRYDRRTETITASGRVHVDSRDMAADAGRLRYHAGSTAAADRSQTVLHDSTFILPGQETQAPATSGRHILKGRARTISTLGEVSTLTATAITSCRLDSPDWVLSAAEIELDHTDEYGKARDAVMRFKDVPFLYTPYIEFPVGERRRSGLLAPEIGDSGSRGVEIALPWYWNIAPQMDAILTPVNRVRRGVGLGGRFRYLTPSTSGSLTGDYLPDDKQTATERYQYRYRQKTSVTDNTQLNVDIQDVSDKDYYNDFGNSLGLTSLTHLNRQADLRYSEAEWKAAFKLQKLKTIDSSTPLKNRPYARLPQITVEGETAVSNTGLRFGLASELVDFGHEDDNRDTGWRLNVEPYLHWPVSGAYWFVDPALRLSHTRYDVGARATGQTTTATRNLLIGSFDGGLFFERDFAGGLLQTLEPRFFYLSVPYRDQDALPLFDTSEPSFSVSQLFRVNRFNGKDRIGDANQLTLSLTSRIIDPHTGDETVRASIGQIFYFEDRKVTLTASDDTRAESDVITELAVTSGAWKANIDLQWDTRNHERSKENYFVRYKSDSRTIFNLGYRLRLKRNLPPKALESDRKDIQQVDASTSYPLTGRVSVYGRWSYSLKDRRHIDRIAGFSYDSCCWSLQLVLQRRLLQSDVTVDENLYDNAVYLQFVLKGLGSVSGSKARNTLEQAILGYEDTLR